MGWMNAAVKCKIDMQMFLPATGIICVSCPFLKLSLEEEAAGKYENIAIGTIWLKIEKLCNSLKIIYATFFSCFA